jgi:hypothetical protein
MTWYLIGFVVTLIVILISKSKGIDTDRPIVVDGMFCLLWPFVWLMYLLSKLPSGG